MSKPVKISVAEPSDIIRSGLIALLKRINISHAEVSEISDMENLRNALSWQRPDILIVNPAFIGIFPVQQLKKETAKTDLKCVALNVSFTDNSALKNYDEVISVYDSVDSIKDKLTKLIREPETDMRHQSLSQREKEVVVCVIKGMTNKQIADHLSLSTHTVITHRRNIASKLQIHSTAGLTIYAIVNKLVELDQISDMNNL